MSISFRSYSNPYMGPSAPFVDFDKEAVHVVARIYRVDTSKPYPVTVDIDGGVALGTQPFGSYASSQAIGTTNAATVGKDVVMNLTSSHGGTLYVDDSADGVTWGSSSGVAVLPGQSIGVRFTATLANYRARFVSLPGSYVSRLHVCSQVRDIGQ